MTDPNRTAQLTRQLAACLRPVTPTALDAIPLARSLAASQTFDVETVMKLGPRLQSALVQLDAFEAHYERSLQACIQLQPLACPRVPLGF